MEDFGREESEGLAYTLYGDEDNNGSSLSTPIVIFHGLLDNKENWKGIATSLANTLSTKIPALRDIILSNLREDTFGINWKVNLKAIEMGVVQDKIFENIYPLHGVYPGRTLVIHTSTSESISTDEYGSLKKHFPNASFKCIENCSNWIHMDQPDELCDIISEYVASI
ncbi:sn-1-specific diacylglycerol lipase ABHD11-like isoform X2 [Centruroides vittatus]|uniref:sn-1-specific diacylglycerol lipase ABHD11-like isoform X2 n=1 Tax=Centruroides vittatus TaxID=120091 RepID=UPI00350F8E50